VPTSTFALLVLNLLSWWLKRCVFRGFLRLKIEIERSEEVSEQRPWRGD
jgi:hypothetical protein